MIKYNYKDNMDYAKQNDYKKTSVLTITTSGFAVREGISTIIHDYYSRLDINSFDLYLVISKEDSIEIINGFTSIGVKTILLPSRKKEPISYFRELIKLLRKRHFDTIYIHGSSAIMAIELTMAKVYGCSNRITHCHNTICNHIVMDKFLRPLFNNMTTTRIACGIDAGKWLYGNQSFTVIENGRDTAIYKFNETARRRNREILGLTQQYIAIGHVGNFNTQKNQKYLIDVFKAIKEKCSHSKLFLMGEGRNREAVEQYVNMLGLTEDVIFTGSISNISDMLQAMDIMVLPSLHEGLPLVVIEWQMAGLPCIVSDRVTKECAFSDLVLFKDLMLPPETWADEVINTVGVDRIAKSEYAVLEAKKAGFDISQNVKVLESLLCGRQNGAGI